MKRIFLSILFLICFSSVGWSATYYVRTDGHDTSCNGTVDTADSAGVRPACAWLSLEKVSGASVTAGDWVYFKRGQTWTGSFSPKSGVNYGATNEAGAKPILTAGGTRVVLFNGCNGNTMSDFTIIGTGSPTYAMQIISSGGTSPLTFNRIDASGGASYQWRFYESVATCNTCTGDATGSGGIPFTFDQAGTVVIPTVVTCNDCIGKGDLTTGTESGFQQLLAATLTCNRCTSYNNTVDGFTASNTGSITCWNCDSHNNGKAAISGAGDAYTSHDTSILYVYESVGYGNIKSCLGVVGTSTGSFLNNTCYDNEKGPSPAAELYITSAGNWTVKNNIFYPTTDKNTTDVNTAGTLTVSNNIYQGSLFNWGGAAKTYSEWVAATSETNSKNTNPLLISATDYRRRCQARDGVDVCSTLVTASDMQSNTVCTDSAYVGPGTVPFAGAYNLCVSGGGLFTPGFNWGF